MRRQHPFASVFLALCFTAYPNFLFAQHVVKTVTVGAEPRGVASNPNNSRTYVANVGSRSISILRGTTLQTTVPVNTNPFEVAVNTKTNRIYAAACNFQAPFDSSLLVLDGKTEQVVDTVFIAGCDFLGLQGVAVNSITNRVWIADADHGQVVSVDGATDQIVARIPTGGQPVAVAVDTRTNEVWVGLNGTAVQVIDGATNQVVQQVIFGRGVVTDIAVNPQTRRVYVASTSDPSGVFVVDAPSRQLIATIPFGSFTDAVDVDPLTNLVFAADWDGNTVGVIDGSNNTVRATVPLRGANPTGVAVNPVTRLVTVTDFSSGQVEILTEQ